MKTTLKKGFSLWLLILPLWGALSFAEAPGRWIAPDSTLPEMNSCSIANQAFQAGEEITYIIYYNWNLVWLSAGEVTFRVIPNGDEYKLSAYGKTYPSYNWFFKVEDRYESFVDTTSLLPSLSVRDVQEGSYTVYDRVEFDQVNHTATSLRGDTRAEAKPTDYSFENCMHDILSIVYFVRNIQVEKMRIGESIPIEIFMDKEVWPLKVTFEGRDDKKKIRGKGKWRSLQFSPDLIEGSYFKEGDKMNIWVSDDRNRMPLLIESPVSVGSVKAVIKKYDGLRYPTEAKW